MTTLATRESDELETAPAGAAIDSSLASEVRATFMLFGMVVAVTLGFAVVSSFALRLLAS